MNARGTARDRGRAEFAAALERSYEEGMRSLEEIADGRPELGMSQADKLSYLQGFSYRLGAPEYASLERFRKSLSRLSKWRPQDPKSSSTGETESISA